MQGLGQGTAAVHSHTLSSDTLTSMYEPSTERSRGAATSDAGSLQQQSSILKNASDPSLRSAGSSFADLETAGFNRHAFPRNDEDIFSTVGGLELGPDAELEALGADIASTSGHEPHSEPARTLFVRHISPTATDEELLSMFKVFGDVRHLYTVSKHRGFVMVTYFDLRSAARAQAALNGAPISGMLLEVHFCAPKGDQTGNQGTVTVFNLDPDTSNDHLVWLFSKFGDVKDIRESPDRSNQKFITFYDTRHGLAALRAMNKAEHLGKLPGNLTPQLAASLSQVAIHDTSAGMEAAQRPQFPSGQSWEAQAQAQQQTMDALVAQMAAAGKMAASRPPSQPSTSAPSPLPGTSPAALAYLAGRPGQPDVQMPQGMALKYQQGQQMHAQHGQHAQQLDQLSVAAAAAAAGSRMGNIHVSDSASSMSSVAGQTNQLLAAAAAGRNLAGVGGGHPHGGMHPHAHMHGHVHKAVPSLATLSEAQALDDPGALYAAAAAAGGMLGGGDQSGAGGASAVDVNATAQALMGLQLSAAAGQGATPEQQLWALQLANAAAAQGQGGAASGLWNAAAAQHLYGNQGAAAAAAAAAANLQALRLQQELQLRQQQQQQQQLAMAANLATLQGQSMSAADLNAAAAQLLHMAGLGHALGSAGGGAGGGGYLAHGGLAGMGLNPAAAANLNAATLGNAAAAQQLLQQALALGNVNALSALGGMQAALGGGGGGRLGAGSYGALSSLSGSTGSGHHGHGARDAAAASRGGGRLSRRTTDPAAEMERKMQQEKLYALDPVKIRAGEDRRTTLMIKNIPNKYTQKMLLATIDDAFRGTYDFFYLPIDFKNKCNVGYAFINMINPTDIIPLVERFNNRRWERFNSEKVCSISYARIQGRAALVAHFQNSSLMHEDKRCRPILFTANGTETTDPEAFANDPSLHPSPPASLAGGASGSGAGPSGSGAAGGGSAASLAAAHMTGPARLRAAAAAAAAAGGSSAAGSSGSLLSGSGSAGMLSGGAAGVGSGGELAAGPGPAGASGSAA